MKANGSVMKHLSLLFSFHHVRFIQCLLISRRMAVIKNNHTQGWHIDRYLPPYAVHSIGTLVYPFLRLLEIPNIVTRCSGQETNLQVRQISDSRAFR